MMKRINALIKRIEAATGERYEVTKYGRGDWSLYRIDDGNAEFVTNTMGAAEMVEVLKAMRAAK